jgi:uncharacterized protein
VAARLIRAAKEKTEALETSSLHYLFLLPEQIPYFEREGFLIRHNFQYHWKNQNFPTFDAFLASLKRRKRKQILKERQELQSRGLRISILRGADLRPEHAPFSMAFIGRRSKRWRPSRISSSPSSSGFFQSMRDQLLLILAQEAGTPVAGALYYENGD